jgi:transposase
MSEKKRRPGRYPDEMRERAVRMVFDHQSEYPSQWKAIESISKKLSINHETLRQWVRRAETDTGQRPGLTTDERAKMKALEREVKELRRANEILKAGGCRRNRVVDDADGSCLDSIVSVEVRCGRTAADRVRRSARA